MAQVKRLRVELGGEALDLILVHHVRRTGEALADMQVFEVKWVGRRLGSLRHEHAHSSFCARARGDGPRAYARAFAAARQAVVRDELQPRRAGTVRDRPQMASFLRISSRAAEFQSGR